MTQVDDQQRAHIKKISQHTRGWRKVHHYAGLVIAIFLLISAISGILLALKKDVSILQPPTQEGVTVSMHDWQPMVALEAISSEALSRHLGYLPALDRIDVRPDKGVAKFQYLPGFWEVQVDAATGKVLLIEKRYSDLIEKIHDGSIISEVFKLISMNLLGIGTVLMIISGLWLWYSPIKIRKIKKLM